MKCYILSALLLPAFLSAQEPTPLKEVDRQLLLEKLAELEESAKSRADGRFSNAMGAFRTGMASDSAAHDLFVKCIEKVRFQDEAKKSQEFREWRRRHKERGDSPAFRRALRHQLSWLVLCMELDANPDIKKALPEKALALFENVLRDHEKLQGAESTLRQDVTTSIFARAYKIIGLKIQKLPKAPLNIAELYEGVIFPPLRQPGKINALREAWAKRIGYEGRLLEKWGPEGSIKGRRPAFEKWFLNERLDLLWQMENDVYSAGDQRGAALKMLSFLEKHFAHPKATDWAAEFRSLISGEDKEPVPEEDQSDES